MSKSPKVIALLLACAGLAAAPIPGIGAIPAAVAADAHARLGIGRPATAEEIAAWDIDVRADGQGLPAGKGNAAEGEPIFAEKCASCHGDFAEGLSRWTVLAGGRGSLKSDNPVKTVGSYWPYLSTAYDYIYRAMPFGNSQSLKPDEVYALIAYILLMNNIIEDDQFALSDKTFTSVRLPNENNFIEDNRPDTATLMDGEPCMKDCKPKVEVTMRASVLDVTPKGDSNDAPKGAIE